MSQSMYPSSVAQEAKRAALYLFVAYAAIAMAIPFAIGPAGISSWKFLMMGIAINCTLFCACFSLPMTTLLALALLPSAAMAVRQFAGGVMTVEYLMSIPFLWLGNVTLTVLFKTLAVEKRINPWRAVAISSAAKAAVVFASAYALYQMEWATQVFLVVMGPMQLVTALSGGILALALVRWTRRNHC